MVHVRDYKMRGAEAGGRLSTAGPEGRGKNAGGPGRMWAGPGADVGRRTFHDLPA